MKAPTVLVLLVLFALALPARAEVQSAQAGAFQLRYEAAVSATPDQAWRSLVNIGGWWSGAHTYSGNARNLRLDARAGGCWCERWSNNSIEHARVLMVLHRDGVHILRVSGGLGPLQELGVSGVLTFTISQAPEGAKIVVSYRVSGDPGLNLDHLAPAVDGVLGEQVARLVRYTGSGRPD